MSDTLTLDGLTASIHADLERCASSREEWIEGMLAFCEHLRQARDLLPDGEFVEWFAAQNFMWHGKPINNVYRCYAINIGRNMIEHPDIVRQVVMESQNTSLKILSSEIKVKLGTASDSDKENADYLKRKEKEKERARRKEQELRRKWEEEQAAKSKANEQKSKPEPEAEPEYEPEDEQAEPEPSDPFRSWIIARLAGYSVPMTRREVHRLIHDLQDFIEELPLTNHEKARNFN